MARRSGPPYRRIVVTFWNDPDVKRMLSLEEKAFLAYLFSNEHSHPCGVYRLTPIHVLDELGIDQDRMKELLEGPIAPFATYDWRTEEVFVHNMAEHQIDGDLLLKTDNRIRWVATQLGMIHSQALLVAFRDRYSDWNLPWNELIDADAPPTPQNPRGSGTMKGVRRGFEGGSESPTTGQNDRSSEEARNHGASEGGYQGGSKPDPAPDPVPEGGIQPPAESSGETLGREGEKRRSSEAHPATDELWTAEVRQAVVDVWHQGSERIEIHGTDRGLGAEYLAASDVLKATDGDVELVRWLILEAPAVMGWAEEARSLRWLATGENLEQAIAEYHRRDSGRNGPTAGVEISKTPERRKPESDRHRELREQVERLRAEAG